MSAVVLVLGATGSTGSAVVDALAATADARVRTATRASTAPTTAEHTRLDWSDPHTPAPAVDGVDRIYLVAPVGEPDPVREDTRAAGHAPRIGRCAARLLTSGHAANSAHVLTGPQALSYDDAAAIMSQVTGRPVRHRSIPLAEYVSRLVGNEYHPAFAAAMAALDERSALGKESAITDAVERITGRPPRSFDVFLRVAGNESP